MGSQIWGGGGGPPANAIVKLLPDGSAEVLAGVQDLGTGTRTVRGASKKTIVGLLAACEASGSYGGLNPSTYPEWAGNVLANGGTPRALTAELLQAADRLVFEDTGVNTRGLLLTTALADQVFALSAEMFILAIRIWTRRSTI